MFNAVLDKNITVQLHQKSLLCRSYITHKGMPEGYVHMVAILSLAPCPAFLVAV